jgi:hypothetical protein
LAGVDGLGDGVGVAGHIGERRRGHRRRVDATPRRRPCKTQRCLPLD